MCDICFSNFLCVIITRTKKKKMFAFRSVSLLVFIVVFCYFSILTAVSAAFTSDAEFVLNQGGITSYINTLFNMSESLPDGSPRNGASARLEGCVRPELFQAVSNSIVFISSNKTGAKNVSECLSYCSALRRLDYWLQTSTNYQNDVSLYELTSGIASNNNIEGTCWCLPQNMTTVVDVILWANTFPQSNINNDNNKINATPFNDVFLPPSCCGPQNNPILSNPGATFVDASVSASAASSVVCPSTVSASERASLVSIFTSKFTCGITSTCGTAAGCVRHPVFKPPISLVKSFDACVPLRYPIIENNNNDNNQNGQGSTGLSWNPVAYVILAFAGVFMIVALCCLARSCFRQKREEDARERLLRARGIHSSSTGQTTPMTNVSNLMNNSGRHNNGSSSSGSSHGDNDSGAEDVQVKDDRTRARQLLSRLPVAALATRPMETCRQMAAMILSSAFKTKPTPKALSEISSKGTSPNSSSCCCSICLDDIDAAPETSDQTLAKLPQKIMLPQCGHLFHTLCLLRQLIFAAQKMDESKNNTNSNNNNHSDLTFLYSPACAVCGCEIVADSKILEQVESVAVGRRQQIVNANPLL